MLKIELNSNEDESLWIDENKFTIGTLKYNTLVLKDPSVSAEHAKIVFEEGKFVLKDNNSDSGTYVNGKKISEAAIKCFDTLHFGNVEAKILVPEKIIKTDSSGWSFTIYSGSYAGKQYVIPKTRHGKALTLGRGKSCDVCIAGSQLAKEHIEISIDNGLKIRDLNSITGTYLNGQKIQEATLKTGDKIRMDILIFTVQGPCKSFQSNPRQHDETPKYKPGGLTVEAPINNRQKISGAKSLGTIISPQLDNSELALLIDQLTKKQPANHKLVSISAAKDPKPHKTAIQKQLAAVTAQTDNSIDPLAFSMDEFDSSMSEAEKAGKKAILYFLVLSAIIFGAAAYYYLLN